MSIGLILLIIVGLLVAFGVAQRVLDRLRLTDRQALLFVGLLFVGGLIPDIPISRRFFQSTSAGRWCLWACASTCS